MMAAVQAWWAFQIGLMQRFWGHRTLQHRHYRAAVEAFSRAIAFQPDYVDAYLSRGLLYWRELQLPAEAVEDFTTVMRIAPGCVEALFYRGMAHQNMGDYAAAVADLRTAVALGEGTAWHYGAYRQLAALEPILDELLGRLELGDAPLLPAGDGIED